MTDFVYILEVEFETALMVSRVRMTFPDRDEAEKFRKDGKRLGYSVHSMVAYPVFTAEKAKHRIKDDKDYYRKIMANSLDDEIKTMI